MSILAPRGLWKPPVGSKLTSGHPLSTLMCGAYLLNDGNSGTYRNRGSRGISRSGANLTDLIASGAGCHIRTCNFGSGVRSDGVAFLSGGNPSQAYASSTGLTPGWSIAVKFALEDVTNAGGVASVANSATGTTSSYRLFNNPAGTLAVEMGNDTVSTTLATPVNSTWYTVISTFDKLLVGGATGTKSHYLGVNQSASLVFQGSGTLGATITGSNIYLGTAESGATLCWIEYCYLWDRCLTYSEALSIIRDPYQMWESPRISRAFFFPISAAFTGVGGVTIGVATASGSATFAAGTKTATGAVTVRAAIASGAATFVAPTYSGAGAVTVGAATASGAGVVSEPTFTGVGTVTVAPATASGAATFVAPVYSGAGAATIRAVVCAGVGTFTKPTYAGVGAATAGAATVLGAATFVKPSYTGAGAVTIKAVAASGAATFSEVVTYSGVGVATVKAATVSGTATFVERFSGIGVVSVGAILCSGSALFTKPIYTGVGIATIGAAAVSGSATFGSGIKTAVGAVTIGPATVQGLGTFIVPPRSAPRRHALLERTNYLEVPDRLSLLAPVERLLFCEPTDRSFLLKVSERESRVEVLQP